MLGRSLLLVCLLLGLCAVNAGHHGALDGKHFGGFFSRKMIEAFANTTGLPFPLQQVPYEMKAMVDEAASEYTDCFMQKLNDSEAAGNRDEKSLVQSFLACTIPKHYDVLTLFWNLFGTHKQFGDGKVLNCYGEMMEDTLPMQLVYLLDSKRLCRTVQFMDVPYCTLKEMCGKSKAFDAIYAFNYALFQFKANGFFPQKGQEICPIDSSEFGRSLNPKLYTNEFDFLKDEVFVRDVCDQYRQPRTFAVANKTQQVVNMMYGVDF
ncbi:hypothetical protein M3Y99_01175000 [Aphelenchoides fujianensis]|nr:hypothetical protein M3Y99_01175000 [Aphelenchoides fujianensis]